MNVLKILATLFLLEIVSPLQKGHWIASSQNNSFVIKENKDDCDHYGTVYPENDQIDEECEVTINPLDINNFVNKIRSQEYHISLLKISLNFSQN